MSSLKCRHTRGHPLPYASGKNEKEDAEERAGKKMLCEEYLGPSVTTHMETVDSYDDCGQQVPSQVEFTSHQVVLSF